MPRIYTHADIQALLELDTARSQGMVVCHMSGEDDQTDLEYRGVDGKWTLATVTDENPANADYLAFLWNHGAAIIRQLVDAVQRDS